MIEYDILMLKLLRLIIHFTFLGFVVGVIYRKYQGKPDYYFVLPVIGTVVFFVCLGLKQFEINVGMALGLFAVFGIIRYRTLHL